MNLTNWRGLWWFEAYKRHTPWTEQHLPGLCPSLIIMGRIRISFKNWIFLLQILLLGSGKNKLLTEDICQCVFPVSTDTNTIAMKCCCGRSKWRLQWFSGNQPKTFTSHSKVLQDPIQYIIAIFLHAIIAIYFGSQFLFPQCCNF